MPDEDSPKIIAALESIDSKLTDFVQNVLKGRATTTSAGDDGPRANGLDDNFKNLLTELNNNVKKNSEHIGLLASAISGGRLSPSNRNLNAQVPSPGGIGGAGGGFRLGYDPLSHTAGEHMRYGNIPGAVRSYFLNAMEPRNMVDSAGNVVYGRTPVGSALRTGQALFNNLTSAIPAVRNEWHNVNAQMQESVDRYITNPTQIGNLAGYAGPGMESMASSAGSYMASRFAAPSMLLSGGTNPNLIGGMFGMEMSRATQKGAESQFRAFTRSLNPFDMLSYDQALNINKAVGGKMFKSEMQQVGVESAVTDLVNTIGYEAVGPAIDTFDLAVKRLHADVGDTNDLMKDMGEFAKSAGKNVNQFITEMNQTVNQLTLQGAQGPQALRAGIGYSSFTNVSGPAMANYLNSPQMTGMYAAMIASNPNSPYNNQKDLFNMALVGPQGLAGGMKPDEVANFQIQSNIDMVKMFQGMGYDENTAINMVAVTTGTDPVKVRDLYKQGPKIIKQQEALKGIGQLTKDYEGTIGSKNVRSAYMEANKGAGSRFKDILRGGPTGFGDESDRILSLGTGLFGRKNPFDEFNIGFEGDPQFEEHVREVWTAMSDGDQERLDQLKKEDWFSEAERAAKLMRNYVGGNEAAWKQLGKYGIEIGEKGQEGYFNTTGAKGNAAQQAKYTSDLNKYLKDMVSTGSLTKANAKTIREQVKAGADPEAVEKRINNMIMQNKIKKDQNTVLLKLDGDAAQYFKMFSKPAGSSEGGELGISPNITPNYDNRNG